MRLTLLLSQLACARLLDLRNASHGLRSQQAAAPVTTDLVVALVVVGLDGLDELGEVGAVSVVDVGECDGGARLAVDQSSQAGLSLDDAVWNAHLAAQGGQKENQLEVEGKFFVKIFFYEVERLVVPTRDQTVEFLTRCEQRMRNRQGSMQGSSGEEILFIMSMAAAAVPDMAQLTSIGSTSWAMTTS